MRLTADELALVEAMTAEGSAALTPAPPAPAGLGEAPTLAALLRYRRARLARR